MFVKPKKSEFEEGDSEFGIWDLEGLLNSMKPSLFVGILISFLGIRTTPLFWSSRRLIISFFFFENIIGLRRSLGIKIFGS